MAFGITRYELIKLSLEVATLAVIMVFAIWMNVRLGEISIENARLVAMQAEDAEARARWNQDLLAYTRGEQSGLKDRVEEIEKKIARPPKVVVELSTPKPAKGRSTPTPTPTVTPKPERGGLSGLFGGNDDE